MKNQLFKILVDSLGDSFALTKRIVGDVMDNTVNAMAVFIGKDPDGNASFAKFNSEGSLVVSSDPGARVNGAPIVHLAGAQTKNQEDEAGVVDLEVSKTYKVDCENVQIIGTRDGLWRLAWVSDYGVTDVETTIGYGFTGSGESNENICPSVKEFTTTGTGDQKLVMFFTPLDSVSDVYANVSAVKLD